MLEHGIKFDSDPTPRRAKAIAEVQDVLGEPDDAAVISTRREQTQSLTPEQAVAAGHVAAHLDARAHAHLPAWVATWDNAANEGKWQWL